MQPLDGLVGERVGQVEVAVVGPAVHPVDAVVLADQRVVLPGLAGQEPPEVVEAPSAGPPVEGTGRALHPARRQVPLPDGCGGIAVELQHLRERRGVLGGHRGVAGERAGELADGTEADGVMVAPGEQRGPGGRAQSRDVEGVVAQPVAGQPLEVRGVDRAAERRGLSDAGVVDADDEDVRRALGGDHVAHQGPVRRGVRERATGPSREGPIRDGESGTVQIGHRLVLLCPAAGDRANHPSAGADLTRTGLTALGGVRASAATGRPEAPARRSRRRAGRSPRASGRRRTRNCPGRTSWCPGSGRAAPSPRT